MNRRLPIFVSAHTLCTVCSLVAHLYLPYSRYERKLMTHVLFIPTCPRLSSVINLTVYANYSPGCMPFLWDTVLQPSFVLSAEASSHSPLLSSRCSNPALPLHQVILHGTPGLQKGMCSLAARHRPRLYGFRMKCVSSKHFLVLCLPSGSSPAASLDGRAGEFL